jgi:tetratricopeptide (TPR) repeat protein
MSPLRGLLFKRATRSHEAQEEVVSSNRCVRVAVLLMALTPAALSNAQRDSKGLDQAFQAAVAEYNAGNFHEAASHLEEILPKLPNHFEVEELLGLVYSSMNQDDKAVGHLQAAAKLRTTSGEALTNLAACLTRLGRTDEAGQIFQKAVILNPKDYRANHNLGEHYVQSGKVAQAIPYLEQAQRVKPDAYDNGYDLAMGYLLTEHYADARTIVQALLKLQDTGELHNLQGQIEEKEGKFVAAANEFETAAHKDPSEENLFDWGTELLLHRTYEPAIEVFRASAQRYPASPRIMIGLGMSLYARGLYEEAVKSLLAAADLTPSDPRCYLFLSRAYDSSPSQADEVIQRFQRYAEQQPKNGLAQYYYAMSLWKGKRVQGSAVDLQQIQSLLMSAITLDDTISGAHLQLGKLFADQHRYEQSITEYKRVVALDPTSADAHYRLATDFTHLGDKAHAQAELAVYEKLRSAHLAEVDKERAEVQQFVYRSKTESTGKQ